MLELLLCYAIAVGSWRATRARHGLALTCSLLLVYLITADLLAAWAVKGPHHVFDVFSYMFLGPMSLPYRAASLLPLPAAALSHPLGLRAARAVISAVASWSCLRESAQQNPLLPRAYTLDGIAMPFAGAAVIELIESVLLLWALTMAAHSA